METKYDIADKLLSRLKCNSSQFKTQQQMKSNKCIYYFDKMIDNSYDHYIYNNIDKRANCIYSSSMLIYNTLGREDSTIKLDFGNMPKDYNVKYEVPLNVIKDTNGKIHSAHLDAKLKNEDEVLFVEAKMLEWMFYPKKLKEDYLHSNQYLITSNANSFITLFKHITTNQTDSKGRYIGINERYDAIQMTIHLLGIYKEVLDHDEYKNKTVKLINIVWDYPSHPNYQKEENEALRYINCANVLIEQLMKNICIDFKVEYIPFSKFINCIDDKNRKDYLIKRYIL